MSPTTSVPFESPLLSAKAIRLWEFPAFMKFFLEYSQKSKAISLCKTANYVTLTWEIPSQGPEPMSPSTQDCVLAAALLQGWTFALPGIITNN